MAGKKAISTLMLVQGSSNTTSTFRANRLVFRAEPFLNGKIIIIFYLWEAHYKCFEAMKVLIILTFPREKSPGLVLKLLELIGEFLHHNLFGNSSFKRGR